MLLYTIKYLSILLLWLLWCYLVVSQSACVPFDHKFQDSSLEHIWLLCCGLAYISCCSCQFYFSCHAKKGVFCYTLQNFSLNRIIGLSKRLTILVLLQPEYAWLLFFKFIIMYSSNRKARNDDFEFVRIIIKYRTFHVWCGTIF